MLSDFVAVPFAVVKFVSDPVRDEPINVGVVGVTGDGIECRFIDSLSRFKSILETDDIKAASVAIRFLRSSIDRSRDRSLQDLSDMLYGQLRLSPLMGGVAEDAAAFLDDQFEIYVSSMSVPMRSETGEDRTKIKNKIRKAIAELGRQSELFSLGKQNVKGKLGTFRFDFGFVNGAATLLHAISFQTREEYALSEAKVLTWAAIDTRKVHPKLKIAAVVAPPLERTATYDEAQRVLSSETQLIDASDQQLSDFLSKRLAGPGIEPIPHSWLEPVPQIAS